MNKITIPARLEINDLALDIELDVLYDTTESSFKVFEVRLNESGLEFDDVELDQISLEVEQLITGE